MLAMSYSNLSSQAATPSHDRSGDMLSYLYPSLKNSSESDDLLQFVQPALPFMTDKEIAKYIATKELQGLNPIVLIIYDIVYDLTNYNNHPGGKNILKKYNGTDCTQIFIDIGHNVDSLKYDIDWKQSVIGRYADSERNNTLSAYTSKSNSNNVINLSNRQGSNFSVGSSIYADSLGNQRDGSELILDVDETNMLRQEIVVENSDLKSNAGNLLKLLFWLLLMVLSHVLFG